MQTEFMAQGAQRRQTLVLVTDQIRCERIIKAGKVIAGITHTQLRVFNVSCETYEEDPAALQYLFDVAKKNGSVLEVAYSSDLEQAISAAISENRCV